jgi:hypothetical protein
MKRLSVLAAAFLLTACGRTEQVAGGGSDQPNKIAAGRILTDSGAPAGGVFVQSWVGEWDPLRSRQIVKPVDSGSTDSNGSWKLHVPDTGSWFVIGRKAGSLAVMPRGDSVGKLEPAATYRGSVHLAQGLKLEALWLGGSSGAIGVDGSQSFSVTTQPGPARLWARVRWTGGVDTILVKDRWLVAGDNSDGQVNIDTASVLLASAESSPSRSALRGVDYPASDTDDGGWFVDTDNPYYGTSAVYPSLFPVLDSAVDTDPNNGRYYSWTMTLGNAIQVQGGGSLQPWAGLGFRLSRRDLDWTGVRKVVLKIRGSGSIWFQVSTASSTSQVGRFGRNINLSGNSWTSLEIPLDSLRPLLDTGTGVSKRWTAARTSVRDVSFYASSQSVRFDIKDVRTDGSRVENW